ncbi:Phage integrase (fragment) [Cupriavidus necator]|uniref:Phage integrase n=1 Tax=Cupriavidus necator TaxID=106590 RepID=A0A1K0J367_CUPNE
MPKPRNAETRGLPTRWQHYHGAYYYQVPPGLEHMWDGKKKFRLGKTLPEAYRVWADRIEHQVDIKTVGQLLERYAMEVVPEKAATTQQHNALAIRKLTAVFGKRSIASITPQVVYW